MIFGSLVLKERFDPPMVISPAKKYVSVHFPGTDVNLGNYQGRPATLIRCTVLAETAVEYAAIRAICHANYEADLSLDYFGVLDGQYYEHVQGSIESERANEAGGYDVALVFAASDPRPFLTATGARIYG